MTTDYYYTYYLLIVPIMSVALMVPSIGGLGVRELVAPSLFAGANIAKSEAVALLEWLSNEKAQKIFADVNMEYPVNPNVPVHSTVASWGSFKQNQINLKNAGENQVAAIKLMDQVGYN